MNPDAPEVARILQLATERLASAGFATATEELDGHRWLLAENDWFAVGVVATETLEQAVEVEPAATAELAARLRAANAGAKIWDAYLALLVPHPIDTNDLAHSEELDSLQYNTRGVRRLVSTAVISDEDLDAALRPLLPLPPAAEQGLPEAFDDLLDLLVTNGIDPEEAARILGIFRQVGSLENA